MALDREIQNLLWTRQVNEINFLMAGIRVSGQGFLELSNRFSDQTMRHRIRVTVRPQLVPRRAIGSYDQRDNKIHLRDDRVMTTPFGRSCIVHECTHAQLDMRGTSTPMRSDESAAFIAETWYLLACGEDVAAVSPTVPTEIITITRTLREAAAGGAAVNMTPDQINVARRAMANLGYRTGHYIYDGIRGYRYRGG